MSLDLDKRQRAMLREMGVRVWLPQTAPAALAEPVLDASPAPAALPAPAAPSVVAKRADTPAAPPTPPAVRPAPAAPSPVQRPAPAAASADVSWRLGESHALYAETANGEGPRWLVLAETPAAAMNTADFNPFDGDAGKLLDNMLKAARLNRAGVVLLTPLARLPSSGGADLQSALPALVAAARPDVVLMMGRLAAQALLQSNEPFGKLRGQVHALHGARLIVTYDATYLLRNPADKAKAWDDLCLAMSLVPPD